MGRDRVKLVHHGYSEIVNGLIFRSSVHQLADCTYVLLCGTSVFCTPSGPSLRVLRIGTI